MASESDKEWAHNKFIETVEKENVESTKQRKQKSFPKVWWMRRVKETENNSYTYVGISAVLSEKFEHTYQKLLRGNESDLYTTSDDPNGGPYTLQHGTIIQTEEICLFSTCRDTHSDGSECPKDHNFRVYVRRTWDSGAKQSEKKVDVWKLSTVNSLKSVVLDDRSQRKIEGNVRYFRKTQSLKFFDFSVQSGNKRYHVRCNRVPIRGEVITCTVRSSHDSLSSFQHLGVLYKGRPEDSGVMDFLKFKRPLPFGEPFSEGFKIMIILFLFLGFVTMCVQSIVIIPYLREVQWSPTSITFSFWKF